MLRYRRSMRRRRRSMRRLRRSMWRLRRSMSRRLHLGQRCRRSLGGHSMRRYRRSLRRRRRSAWRRRRSRGVPRDIGDCGVGITTQMCNRVTNHGDMSTFTKPVYGIELVHCSNNRQHRALRLVLEKYLCTSLVSPHADVCVSCTPDLISRHNTAAARQDECQQED